MTLHVSKNHEYFISIANHGIHSFVMLGVMKDNNVPTLIARVGKTNDVDPVFGKNVKITCKAVFHKTIARLADEGITRDRQTKDEIKYQAYSLTYEQVKDFLSLLADIESIQLENAELKARMIAIHKKENETDERILNMQAFKAYVPVEESTNGQVRFEHMQLNEWETNKHKTPKNISSSTQSLSIKNTCRTTAIRLLEPILAFRPNVSSSFLVSPKYKTTLRNSSYISESFYILPPPTVYKQAMTANQFAVINAMYKRLEKIPTKTPDADETRNKFNALKETYLDITGSNQLSATELLKKINEHLETSQNTLYQKRAPNFFSRLFGTSSSTKAMFQTIQKKLTKEAQKNMCQQNVSEEPITNSSLGK